MIDLRGHMPRFTLKNECFPIYLLGNAKNVCWNPQNRDHFFQDDRFEGSHAYIYLKNEHFPIYLLGNPKNVCWNPQNRACFSKTIDLRGHMPRFTLKWMFSHLSPWKPQNVCWNPQNSACFSKMIDLRGHMPRFTLKMNVFPIFLTTPELCVETLRRGIIFPRWSIWGVTCLGLL